MTNDDNLPIEPFPPGDLIREELAARGWLQSDLAEILGKTDAFVSEVVTGKRGITTDTAQALAQAFGTSPQWWLNLETSYRLALDRTNDNRSVARRSKLYSKAPVREMINRGWIEPSKNSDVLEHHVLRFLGIDHIDDEPYPWPHAARKSAQYTETTPAQTAWVTRAVDLARAVHAKPYARKRFPVLMAALRTLLIEPNEIRRVPATLADHGVRFLVIEPLRGTKIDGASFWLDRTSPVVVVSMRYDRIDAFWHTLFHELSHIYERHGLEDDDGALDLELIGGGAERRLPEREILVNRMAAEASIPPQELQNFISRVSPLYSKRKITDFARRIGVHPGIVVGQLQHRDEVDWSHNREMLVKVRHILTQSALTDGWGSAVPITGGA